MKDASFLCRRAMLLAAASLVASTNAIAAPAMRTEKARSAESFVDSMGIATHLGYSWTPYETKIPGSSNPWTYSESYLKSLGIRHIRDGIFQSGSLDENARLYKRLGVKSTLVCTVQQGVDLAGKPYLLTIPGLIDQIKTVAAPAAIDAVEGPNETDTDKAFRYPLDPPGGPGGGSGFPAGTRQCVHDLNAAMRADPATRAIPVIAASTAERVQGKESPFADFTYEVAHSYNWEKLAPMSGPNGLPAWIADADSIVGTGNAVKPVYVTETGYQSKPGGIYAVDEQTQAKYIPRLYADYFQQGIVRTCVYELIDENGDTFGLIANGGRDASGAWRLTPKPSFRAVQSLIAALGEGRWDSDRQEWIEPRFTPGSLALSIQPAPGTQSPNADIQHVLLQKSNGDFDLLIWNEVNSFDPVAGKPIENAPVPVTIAVGRRLRSADCLVQKADGSSFVQPLTVGHGDGVSALRIAVPDSVAVVVLHTAGSR